MLKSFSDALVVLETGENDQRAIARRKRICTGTRVKSLWAVCDAAMRSLSDERRCGDFVPVRINTETTVVELLYSLCRD